MDVTTAKISLLTAPSKPIGHLMNLAPACEIWYDGSDAAGVKTTSAWVEYATNTFTLSINGAVDSRIGSSGVLNCNTTYTTYLLLSDHINSIPGWHMRLLGVLRADSTDATIEEIAAETNCLRLAVTCKTTTAKFHTYCVTNAEGATSIYANGVDATHRSDFGKKVQAIYNEHGAANCLFYLKVVTDDTGAVSLKYYSINGATLTETLLGTAVLTADTGTEQDFTAMPLTALAGERLVVRIAAATSINAITTSIINAKSIRT